MHSLHPSSGTWNTDKSTLSMVGESHTLTRKLIPSSEAKPDNRFHTSTQYWLLDGASPFGAGYWDKSF